MPLSTFFFAALFFSAFCFLNVSTVFIFFDFLSFFFLCPLLFIESFFVLHTPQSTMSENGLERVRNKFRDHCLNSSLHSALTHNRHP